MKHTIDTNQGLYLKLGQALGERGVVQFGGVLTAIRPASYAPTEAIPRSILAYF